MNEAEIITTLATTTGPLASTVLVGFIWLGGKLNQTDAAIRRLSDRVGDLRARVARLEGRPEPAELESAEILA